MEISSLTETRVVEFKGVKNSEELRECINIFGIDLAVERYKENVTMDRIKIGNVSLVEGTTEVARLIGGIGTPTAFDESNAYIGVGDGDDVALRSQTGLQGTNKYYKSVESGYPTLTEERLEYYSLFDAGEANFDWQEYTLANGDSDSAVNLLRVVEDNGVKEQGAERYLRIRISLS